MWYVEERPVNHISTEGTVIVKIKREENSSGLSSSVKMCNEVLKSMSTYERTVQSR